MKRYKGLSIAGFSLGMVGFITSIIALVFTTIAFFGNRHH